MMSDTLESKFAALRQEMVAQIMLHANLVSSETGLEALSDRVLDVMGRVPRHEFVPAELRPFAYFDGPLPIGYGKTISQPFIVALMTDLLDIQAGDSILEVGTGLGYQASVMAALAETVYSVEIIEELAQEAGVILARQGYTNIHFRIGDGSTGWPEHAPFDKVLVAAAPELIPPALLNQVRPGGKMVIPAGIEDAQQLILAEKDHQGRISTREILPVRFSALVVTH